MAPGQPVQVWWPHWCDGDRQRVLWPCLGTSHFDQCEWVLHVSPFIHRILCNSSLEIHFSFLIDQCKWTPSVSLSPKLYTAWLLYIQLFHYTFLKCATLALDYFNLDRSTFISLLNEWAQNEIYFVPKKQYILLSCCDHRKLSLPIEQLLNHCF